MPLSLMSLYEPTSYSYQNIFIYIIYIYANGNYIYLVSLLVEINVQLIRLVFVSPYTSSLHPFCFLLPTLLYASKIFWLSIRSISPPHWGSVKAKDPLPTRQPNHWGAIDHHAAVGERCMQLWVGGAFSCGWVVRAAVGGWYVQLSMGSACSCRWVPRAAVG